MTVGYVEVAKKFYLFTSNGGQRTTNQCVIYSHGGEPIFNSTFTVPSGMVVKFYVAEKHQLQTTVSTWIRNDGSQYITDAALIKISTGIANAVEKIKADNECTNYGISKFQKSSNSGITGGRLTNFLGNRTRVTYDDIIEHLNSNRHSADILTVRDRAWHLQPTLREAVIALDQLGYTEVRCDFCRSPSLMPKKGRTDVS